MLTWLGAALAFSLSMVVFSTIVSALTEAIHRTFGMREAGLRRMLDRLFAETIGDAGRRGAFVERLTRNLAAPERSGWRRRLPGWLFRRGVGDLHWREFIRRVVEDDAANELLAEKSEPVLEALAVRYERFGADATTFFEERARSISIALAFVAAFALNVDAVTLFSGFLKDRALTERVVADAEQILGEYEAARNGGARAEEAEPAAALDRSIDRLRAALASPGLAGLPVGSDYYPWCATQGVDPRCEAAAAAGGLLGRGTRLGSWLLSVLLAGFLIGLGGPFWFDAYSKLAAFVGGATGRRAAGEAETAGGTAPLALGRVGSTRELAGGGGGPF